LARFEQGTANGTADLAGNACNHIHNLGVRFNMSGTVSLTRQR
jgi:hypothetical protein